MDVGYGFVVVGCVCFLWEGLCELGVHLEGCFCEVAEFAGDVCAL